MIPRVCGPQWRAATRRLAYATVNKTRIYMSLRHHRFTMRWRLSKNGALQYPRRPLPTKDVECSRAGDVGSLREAVFRGYQRRGHEEQIDSGGDTFVARHVHGRCL